jgi:hypothetical protein
MIDQHFLPRALSSQPCLLLKVQIAIPNELPGAMLLSKVRFGFCGRNAGQCSLPARLGHAFVTATPSLVPEGVNGPLAAAFKLPKTEER